MVEILFTICGRGGSKGVKNKNIKSLCGRPLLAWTIFDAELAFNGNTDVQKTIVVDSDSDIILDIAKCLNPQILLHKRKLHLAGDRVSKIDVIREVLKDVAKETRKSFDVLIDLDITSPLRTASDIENAYEHFCQTEAEIVISVVPARRNPYFNMVEKNQNGKYGLSKQATYTARQQAPMVFDMNASIYIYKPQILSVIKKSPLEVGCEIYVMKDFGVIDIDTEHDFAMMELILSEGLHLLPEDLVNKVKALSMR